MPNETVFTIQHCTTSIARGRLVCWAVKQQGTKCNARYEMQREVCGQLWFDVNDYTTNLGCATKTLE